MPKQRSATSSCDGGPKDDYPTLDDESIDWHKLAACQGTISGEVIQSKTDGHVFALEDRSSHAHTSWRRVLVRVQPKKSEVHVFGAERSIIEDSNKQVCHGKQPMALFLDQFEPGGKELYRSPQIRQHPRERRALHSVGDSSRSSSKKVTSTAPHVHTCQ